MLRPTRGGGVIKYPGASNFKFLSSTLLSFPNYLAPPLSFILSFFHLFSFTLAFFSFSPFYYFSLLPLFPFF